MMYPTISTKPNVSVFALLENDNSMPILTLIPAGDSVVTNIYGENLARLQSVKAQYDPNNVFNKMHPIPLSTGDDLKKWRVRASSLCTSSHC